MRFSIDDVEIGTVEPDDNGGFWEYGGFDNVSNTDDPWQYGSKMAPFDEKVLYNLYYSNYVCYSQSFLAISIIVYIFFNYTYVDFKIN